MLSACYCLFKIFYLASLPMHRQFYDSFDAQVTVKEIISLREVIQHVHEWVCIGI